MIPILASVFLSVWFRINASNKGFWRKLRKKHGTVGVGDQAEIVDNPRLPRVIGYCPMCARSLRSASVQCTITGKKNYSGGDFVAKRRVVFDDPMVKINLDQTILVTDMIEDEEVTFQAVCINSGCYIPEPGDCFWLFDDDGKVIAETPSLEMHTRFSKPTLNN